MQPRIYTLAFITAGSALSGTALAAEDCGRIVVHAVNQSCAPLPNGLNLCQPVALMGPPAPCRDASSPPLKQVPLAFPSLQMPQGGVPAYTPPQWPTYTPPQFQWPAFPAPQAPAAPAPQIQWPQFQPPQYTPPQYTPPQFPIPQWPGLAAPAPKPQTTAPEKPDTAPSAVTPAPIPTAAQPATPAAQPAPASLPAPAPAMTTTPVQAPVAAPAPTHAPARASGPVAGVPDVQAHFDFDSAELTEAGRKTLDAWLAQAPVGMPVLVSGHADRLGRETYNLELSLRRAMAVRDYLVSRGKDARDIRVVGKGATEPVKRCKGKNTPATKSCLAPNRRVEIVPE